MSSFSSSRRLQVKRRQTRERGAHGETSRLVCEVEHEIKLKSKSGTGAGFTRPAKHGNVTTFIKRLFPGLEKSLKLFIFIMFIEF